MLIVFEGLDGCGKGTQIELLTKELDCTVFKYPTSKTPELNAFLEKKSALSQKEVFHLFLKDIVDEQAEVKKALAEGIVILDRYVLSTIAYGKDNVSFEDAKKAVLDADLLKPDLVILFDIPPEVSYERKKKQKSLDRYESDIIYLKKVRSNYLQLHKERFLTANWHKVDANQSISEVHKQVMKVLNSELSTDK